MSRKKTIKNKTTGYAGYPRSIKNKTRRYAGYSRSKKNKKQFFFNPKNPDKSFDVYIDKNPSDTIPIKYKTLQDVSNTINKLEYLYKKKKYTHKRIWQVAMIMKVRLGVIKAIKPQQYALAKKYLNFLKHRTSLPQENRYKLSFT